MIVPTEWQRWGNRTYPTLDHTAFRLKAVSQDDRPLALDLFCGSGAATLALKATGYRVVAAVDINPVCAETYRANHPEVTFKLGDIKTLPTAAIGKLIPKHRSLEIMMVCAPCQPFSSQNRYRGNSDRRALLVVQAIRFARCLKPRTILFENVPGLASSEIFARLKMGLQSAGYSVSDPTQVDAADFGVPQRRTRCIVVAVRKPFRVPEIRKASQSRPRQTVRTALAGLRSLRSGERDPIDAMHASREHQPIALERLAHIPKDGGSRGSLPAELQLKCHAALSPKSFSDVYGRLRWDDVAPTLTTGCTDLTRGRYAHPQDDRAITLREAARLQSFPDAYRFSGSRSQVAEQIGNAVPYEMIREIVASFESR